MFKKWWLIRHIADTEYVPIQLITILGFPFCSYFYTALGPFPTEAKAITYAESLNHDAE